MRQTKQQKAEKQKRLIGAILKAGRRKGMSVDDLRSIAHARYGCEPKLHAMTIVQLNNFLDYLNDKVVPDRASDRQLWKIRTLAEELGWWPDQENRMYGFIKRIVKRDIISIEQLRFWEASDVIEGMKHLEVECTTVEHTNDQDVSVIHVPDRLQHA